MKQFSGFPARMQFTPIPNLFFSSLLPQISDMAELKTTLHIFWLLYRKRGYPRFTTYNELLADISLMSSLREGGKLAEEALRKALEMAAKRGTIIHMVLDRDGTQEDVYFLNTESDRQNMAKIRSGELNLPRLKAKEQAHLDVKTEPQPDIFTLYEQNIGMLTPLIAEELKEAERLYPASWIEDAFREAINLNQRRWKYIVRILERWAAQGKDDGAYRRDSAKGADRYTGQKYDHMVRR